MKKVLLMAAICCAAMAGQAEVWPWHVVNAGAYNGYKIDLVMTINDLENIDSPTLAAFNELYLTDAYWEYVGATTWEEFYAVVDSGSTAYVVDGSADGTVDILNGPVAATFFLCPDGIAPGKDYIVTKTLYDSSLQQTFDFSNVEVLSSGKFMTDSAPEPTSGILLLLGMGALALKRKRA